MRKDIALKIISLTLNPAYDLHLYTDTLRLLSDNAVKSSARDAGGKGINLARALACAGVGCTSYLLLPEESEREYLAALERDGILPLYDTVSGFIRENINLHTNAGDTVITTEGTAITAADIDRVGEAILPLIDSETYLVFSGGIPKGSDKGALISFLSETRGAGARLVLDSRSLTGDEILGLSPYLIKPNIEEASALLGDRVSCIRDAAFAAEGLFRDTCGRIGNILITAGAEGAVLVCGSGAYRATAPQIEAISAVGAGDSTVAGFLTAVLMGFADSEKLRLATAFGTAACLEAGTRPPQPEKIREIYSDVTVEKISSPAAKR